MKWGDIMSNKLSTNLRELRMQNGLKQIDVADKLNLKQQTYSRYEKGEREPNVDLLMQMADLYKVPIDVLVGRYKLENTNKGM